MPRVRTSALIVGDVFRCARFADARCQTKWCGGDLVQLRKRLGFMEDACYYTRKERRAGGWSRETEQRLDLSAHDSSRATALFRVVSVDTAWGPPSTMSSGDSRPSGYRIVAERVDDVDETVEFHTSPDFIDCVEYCERVTDASR